MTIEQYTEDLVQFLDEYGYPEQSEDVIQKMAKNFMTRMDDLLGNLEHETFETMMSEDYKEIEITKEYCVSADGYEAECCPYCENEIEIRWNINTDGFKAFCPVCGKRLMLCDACQHRYGEFHDDCDYNSKTCTCRFNKEEN